MNTQKKPKPLLAGIIYGTIVYWGVWIGSLIVIIGSMLAFFTKANFISPSYYISSIWGGMTTEQIWKGAIDTSPPNFWYLFHLGTGDGLTTFGIVFGTFSVVLALFGTAIVMLKEKNVFFAFLAIVVGLIVFVSMLGLIPLPS